MDFILLVYLFFWISTFKFFNFLEFHHPNELFSPNVGKILLSKDWYRACESYKPNDGQWALQAKAILDRLQLVLADRSQNYQKKIQPSVQYLGHLLGIEKWLVCYHLTLATILETHLIFEVSMSCILGGSFNFVKLLFCYYQIDIFTEEVIRAGSAAIFSTLINRFDPILRKVANLGW